MTDLLLSRYLSGNPGSPVLRFIGFHRRAPPIFSGGKGLLLVLSTLNREYLPMHLAPPVSPPSVLDPSKGKVAGFGHGQESPESNNPLPNPLMSTAFFQVPLKVKKGFEQLLEKFLLLKALERQLIHPSTVSVRWLSEQDLGMGWLSPPGHLSIYQFMLAEL